MPNPSVQPIPVDISSQVGQQPMLNSLPVTISSDQIDVEARSRRNMAELEYVKISESLGVVELYRGQGRVSFLDRRGGHGRGSTR